MMMVVMVIMVMSAQRVLFARKANGGESAELDGEGEITERQGGCLGP